MWLRGIKSQGILGKEKKYGGMSASRSNTAHNTEKHTFLINGGFFSLGLSLAILLWMSHNSDNLHYSLKVHFIFLLKDSFSVNPSDDKGGCCIFFLPL